MLIVLVINYLLPFLGTSKELDLQSDFVYTGLVSAIASTYFLIVFSIKRKKEYLESAVHENNRQALRLPSRKDHLHAVREGNVYHDNQRIDIRYVY